MSYRKNWSKTFYADEFKDPETALGHPAPKRCNDGHVDAQGRVYCLEAYHTVGNLAVWGLWKLRSPIRIHEVMPGFNHKIVGMSSTGLHNGSFGSLGGKADCRLRLYGDSTQIWQSTKLSHPHKAWGENPFNPQQEITSYSELDVGLRQDVESSLPSTWVSAHDAKIKVDIEYYVDTPPVQVPVTINVLNQDKGTPVKNARVTLKSGPKVIADNYTGSQGTVTFQNINTGSYTIRVIADNYTMLEESIKVMEPAVEYDVYLVPIPSEPLSWWVLPAAVGIGIIGFVTIVPALTRRQPYQQPVVVVR